MARCCGFPNLGKANAEKTYARQSECDVCVGLDNNREVKEVVYCKVCDAWICTKCTPRWLGRGWLATKKMFGY